MKTLTPRQQEVLNFIRSFQKERGAPPSFREIAYQLGFKSLNTVQQHLRLICQKGYIHLNPGKARGIDVGVYSEPAKNKNAMQVPLIGIVAAGQPITAVENISDYIFLDPGLFQDQGLFTLRVKGDSMRGIGVLDGDYVVVRQQSQAASGEIVVVIIEDEATLKRYLIEEDKIILHAENPAYADIIIPSSQKVWIAGKMVGLIRKY
jgi:repressor LexA